MNRFEKKILEDEKKGEVSDAKKVSRRDFFKKTAMGVTGAMIYPKEILANKEINKNKLKIPEKLMEDFAQMINSEMDRIDKVDEESKADTKTQSMLNNLKYIYSKLGENKNLVDIETYRLFAHLSNSHDNQERFNHNLSLLIHHLAEKGYYFNYLREPSKGNEEKIFVSGELEEKKMSDYPGVEKLFPEMKKHYSKIFKTSKNELGSEGFTEAVSGLPIVNEERIKRFRKEVWEKSKPDNDFWSDFSAGDFIVNTEANEFAHHSLNSLYNFNSGTKLSWNDFKEGISRDKIRNSGEANEFISDAVSINNSPRAELIILARNLLVNELMHYLNNYLKKNRVRFHVSTNYRYTNNFFKQQLGKILSNNKLENNFSIWAEEFKKVPLKRKNLEEFLYDKTKETLSILEEMDIGDIQDAYLNEAKNILKYIEKNKKR